MTKKQPSKKKGAPVSYAIQPHNFRRYYVFNRSSIRKRKPYPTLLDKYGLLQAWNWSEKNHASEIHVSDFNFCTIIVRKKSIEIINKNPNLRKWRIVSRSSRKQIDERVEEIRQEMEEHCLNTLHRFVAIFGGSSTFKEISREGKRRSEEVGIKGDEFIDNLPDDMIFHDTVSKKVYKEKTELYGLGNTKNYLLNQSLKDFAPEIVSAIEESNKQAEEKIQSMHEAIEATLGVVKVLADTNLQTAKLLKNLISVTQPPPEAITEKEKKNARPDYVG